jgi:ATP-dependent Clp protease ATP-binding subunit ClpA
MSLTSALDAECLQALDLAKRWLPQDGKLDVETLLCALCHYTNLKEREEFQPLVAALPVPKNPPRHEAGRVAVTDELRETLQSLAAAGSITPLQLFAALAGTSSGRRKLPPDQVDKALKVAGVRPQAPVRTTAAAASSRFAALRPFGRLLTDPSVPLPPLADGLHDKALHVLLLQMMTPRYRNAVLVGPSGVGKTSLVWSLAAKLRQRDPQLPRPLHDLELLEFSQERSLDESQLQSFLRALEANPGIVLYIDKLAHFMQPMVWTNVQRELIAWFGHLIETGVVGCLGSLHTPEWAQLADKFPSLMRRFRVLQLEPPYGAVLEGMVRARAEQLADYYQMPLAPSLLARAISLTDQHLKERIQPEKTLRLLEAACGRAALESAAELSETHLLQAMEDFVGPILVANQTLGVEEIYQSLRSAIVGQDDNLHKLAELVVAGRSDRGWFLRPGPRGVFLFGGPTGVGKTETAIQLARLLGQGRDNLIRIDCQNFQGSSSGWEANTLTWRLLGVAPGYIGWVPGCRDGQLVRVRDFPECVLLLDEFEKADATVGKIFLRILDEGKAQDSEGHELDFRRSFVIMTSNAGVSYADRPSMGFKPSQSVSPTASVQDIHDALKGIGLGQEFLARIQHLFVFLPLLREHVRELVERQLAELEKLVSARGKKLQWSSAVIDWLARRAESQPNMGVRFILSLIRTHILDPLNRAVLSGEMDDTVTTIELLLSEGADGEAPRRAGGRFRLVIHPS